MDRKQLKAFTAVVELHSFSAAARSLNTVQSNVSAHVARLETELGVTLIDRATTEPTDEGRAVLRRARRIEAEFEALDSDVASLRDEVSGTVRLGSIGTVARWLVPPLLNELAEQFPLVSVIILDATTSSLVLNLLSGAVDLALLNLPLNELELRVDALFDEDRVLIAPPDHPLYCYESLTLEEIVHHEILLEAPGSPFRTLLEEVAASEGVILQPKAEFDGMRLLASLVFSGFGAGIVPSSAAPIDLGGEWRRIPITGAVGRSVGLGVRRRSFPSAAQRVVADTIRTVIAREAAGPSGIYPALTAGN